MPKILEMQMVDDELWCCVGKMGEFESGVSLWTPEEQGNNYQQGYRDGLEAAEKARLDAQIETSSPVDAQNNENMNVKELLELKQRIQLQRALGLAEAIVKTANWEYINRGGLKRTTEEIAEILESLLPTSPEEKNSDNR